MDGLFAAENTVLGVGNTILSDEGFGVRVVEYLQKNFTFPPNVALIDGGTLGVELLHFVWGTRRLLIVDSIDGGVESGTTFHLRGNEIRKHFAQKISAHEVGIQDVLTMLELSNKLPHVELIGAQPFSLEAGVELTEPMKILVPKFAAQALEILRGWGLEVQR
ncbi:MAG: HyaD/HybD family hydrogenase maturation endopeptidase [Quinella sp. 2Q5]|nr:HyaD/HybD family hydrogenase maturation endopeptidase [Quinella sp. 2Q5]